MNFSRLTHAANDAAPDDPAAQAAGAPVRTVAARLPAIEDGPILMHTPESRRAIPGFDGEDDDDAPFDIADLVRQAEEAASATRSWPDIWPATPQRADGPARAVDGPWRELAARRSEMAALQEIQHKQAAALRRARDEIFGLDDQVKLLRARLTQQEKDAAAAERARQRAEDEKAALAAELEQTNANFAELLRQTAELNDAFDKREKEIASVRATVASLKAELAAKASETDLTAAIEEAKTRYYREFGKRFAQFEGQVEKMARMIGARDEHISNLEDENATLAKRCEALAARLSDLEAANRNAEAKLETQTATVTFLDSALQAEREASGQKIAELATDLQRERLERAADARESALVCKEIVQLLPKLARQPGRVVDAIERAGRAAANDFAARQAKTAAS